MCMQSDGGDALGYTWKPWSFTPMIITLRICISFGPIVRCAAVSSSHSPSRVAL